MRKSCILMHISSLPSDYGIGKMGKSAYKFVDFLKKSGVKCWQILPLSPTSYGDSPYQSFSINAGNPYFIDFETLQEEGLLYSSEYSEIVWEDNKKRINYSTIYNNCFDVLKRAFSRFKSSKNAEYSTFITQNKSWLNEYALFMALKFHYNGKAWSEWDEKLVMRDKNALLQAEKSLADEINFFKFVQFKFYQQWFKLKNYANNYGIEIIGDIPIYCAYDSVEAWAEPELFCFDKNKVPIDVAGCPPDMFSPTGQLWGNPLYNWDYHKSTEYKWWISRIEFATKIYDIVRIDHFRGFESFYTIPYGNETAEIGEWRKGPNAELFKLAEKKLGALNIIAEDLGFITPEVKEMLQEVGYPGMKVLQFAFDNGENENLPHNFESSNYFAYTGTHDNETLTGWIKSSSSKNIRFARKYLNVDKVNKLPYAIIKATWSSVATVAVAQMQDFIESAPDCRMNTPSTLGKNWQFRTVKSDFTPKLSKKIKKLNKMFNR